MKKQNKKRIFNCSEARSIQDLVQVQARPVIVGETNKRPRKTISSRNSSKSPLFAALARRACVFIELMAIKIY
jgi:hypothetical protein